MGNEILIIEDDFETQFLFTELLQIEGYKVKTVSNGVEAMDYLTAGGKPSLIFMDLNFPGGSPDDLMKEFRDHQATSKTPVFIISGNADIQDHSERLNANGFVKKPFEIDPLLEMIKTAI